MRGRLFALREYLRQSLWFIPVLSIVGAIMLSEIGLAIDRRIETSGDRWYVFSGGPDTARTVVSTIASSMITFTGLVFSITMLVLQLSSSQLSPRIIRSFLRDRTTQLTLGAFIATFTYSLLSLRRLGAVTDDGDLASVTVWGALALVAVSVLLFVYYIHHTAQAIRPVTIISNIKEETVDAIDEAYPSDDPESPPSLPQEEPDIVVELDNRSGILVDVSLTRLKQVANEFSLVVELLPQVGTFVPRGSPLLCIWGDCTDQAQTHLRQAVTLGRERTMEHDPGFGIRQLVDVAVRALSPGINDPTTAVQVLDALHDLLIIAVDRPTTELAVSGDEQRVFLHRPGWDDLVKGSIDEIRQYGSDSSQVLDRLERLLVDLLERTAGERKPVLRNELELVRRAKAEQFEAERGLLGMQRA